MSYKLTKILANSPLLFNYLCHDNLLKIMQIPRNIYAVKETFKHSDCNNCLTRDNYSSMPSFAGLALMHLCVYRTAKLFTSLLQK